ncbi:hypothetical protein [Streptomyces sp. AS58]|uniref:hypothetical protein n=1 Tax=Streptomyces sp. AS58 TaxID=1519489 RepID=UPI00131C5512|nr:hypothetical protein [Streptomyces sp. AS58]
MSLSVHRGKSAALVWPRGAGIVLEDVSTEYMRDLVDCSSSDGVLVDHGGSARKRMMRLLCETLDVPEVGLARWTLGVGQRIDETNDRQDVLLLSLDGGFECRIDSAGEFPGKTLNDSSIHLRARFGEVLYIPKSLGFSVSGAHSLCSILKVEF